MFIVTLGDVFGIIILLALVGYLVYFFVSGRKATKFVNDKQHEHKKKLEPKPQPRDTAPKPLPKLPIRAWLIIAVQAAVLIAVIWLVAHTLKI